MEKIKQNTKFNKKKKGKIRYRDDFEKSNKKKGTQQREEKRYGKYC